MKPVDIKEIRAETGSTVLIIVCAWCGDKMGEKDGHGQTGVTHGICADCLAKEGIKKGIEGNKE